MKAGTVLDGKYVIVSVIGQGGMSRVYLACDRRLGKKWAVKEIREDRCDNYDLVEKTLLGEADILKRLSHPSLPGIIDIFKEGRSLFIVMEYIKGRTLRDILDEAGILEERQVAARAIEVCDVLAYLHSRKPPIIYRDMKPSNIMIRDDGRLMLVDFGTAREFRPEGGGDTVCLGTRGYAAPEQYRGGGQPDIRTDIYGLGVTMYQLLTGRDPQKPPYRLVPVRKLVPEVSPGMEHVIARCTRHDPRDRFETVMDLKYALMHLEEESLAYRRRQIGKVAVAGFMLGLSVLSFTAGGITGRYETHCRRSLADYYLQLAEASGDEDEAGAYFEKTLKLTPDYVTAYRTMLDHYCRGPVFTTDDEAAVVSLVNTPCPAGTCLNQLEKKDREACGSFCYDLGLACFYDLGGTGGKSQAAVWLARAKKDLKGTEARNQYDRAGLYLDICSYYQEFLDKSSIRIGEHEEKSYQGFFALLQKLNRMELKETSSKSDQAAAWLISREVLTTFSRYADIFLESGISPEKIRKEMRRCLDDAGEESSSQGALRRVFFEKNRTEEEMEELRSLYEDVNRKLKNTERRESAHEDGI